MQTMSQLKKMQEQMAAELARVPQYRAMKAMDRFLMELSQIYDDRPEPSSKDRKELQEKVTLAIENRLSGESFSAGSAKVTPYFPDQRVA